MKNAIAAAIVAAMLFPGIAQADWNLEQGGGSAVMRQRTGDMDISFFCSRGRTNQLQVSFSPWSGETPQAMMLWIQAPDGRLARHSMDFFGQDSAISFLLQTSSIVLDQLRNAAGLEFTIDGRQVATTDARGTGAFRLAVEEQCRF